MTSTNQPLLNLHESHFKSFNPSKNSSSKVAVNDSVQQSYGTVDTLHDSHQYSFESITIDDSTYDHSFFSQLQPLSVITPNTRRRTLTSTISFSDLINLEDDYVLNICWLHRPSIKWTISWYVGMRGAECLHMYLWILKDICWYKIIFHNLYFEVQ